MIPIFVLFLLSFSFINDKLLATKKTIIFVFCLLFWWFLESFRWESGTDFSNYYNNFDRMKLEGIWTDRYEWGYNFTVFFFKYYLKSTFYFFNAVYYAVIFLMYFFSIKKATQNPILFVFIFFCFAVGLMGSTRQLMSVSIMFFASIYFLEKRKLWFILSILIASLFHRTVIICLVFVFFTYNIQYKYWFYLIAFAVFAQLSGFNGFIMEKVILLLPKAYTERFFGYLSLSTSNIINLKIYLFGILRRVLPIALLFIYKDKLKILIEESILQYVLNIMLFSLFAYVMLSFNFTFIISRISIYFNIFEALFYVWLISLFMKEKKYVYTVGLISFFLVLCIKSIMYYPHLFLPYKTIFFTL
ncbi:EpsG family protein [Chryseobacterium ginsenosidimutans]|uniref:EpsG family protein n=1 Tax=Chryseobacterium ginsenosidimutans TaxID=687846 RepID=UPI003CD05AC2